VIEVEVEVKSTVNSMVNLNKIIMKIIRYSCTTTDS